MQDKPDEKKCLRCGRCCFAKLWIGGRIYYTPFPCKYLDLRTRLCTVYDRRHEVNPECLSIEAGIKLGVFPKDCPYVRDIPDYTPPIEGVIDEEVMRRINEGAILDEADLLKIARERGKV